MPADRPEEDSNHNGVDPLPRSESWRVALSWRQDPAPVSAWWRFVWRLAGLAITMRPHQWIKNVFVLAPAVFAKNIFDRQFALEAGGAFATFCLLASAVYTLNDLADREVDRQHPVKRFRPIAAGRVPVAWARILAIALVLLSFAGAALGPQAFLWTVVIYFVQNVAYSFRLKHVPYVDVVVIALGFVLRVLAGGFATQTQLSGYLLSCTALLALFLGFGKRRHELALTAGARRAVLEAYSRKGLDRALGISGVATLAAYLAYCFDPQTRAFFNSTHVWWTSVFVLLGMARFAWLVVGRPRAESPTQEMLKDGPFVAILFGWVLVVLSIVYNLGPQVR
jgi:decaprenyl-phosphate phosphoribosyltransferase